MGKKLYVGNLSFDMTDEDLQEAFAEFGEVTSAVIIKDRISGRSRGFGFVEFSDDESAKNAKEGMDGKDLKGRALKVDEAREQRRTGGGDRDGGGGGDRRRRF